MTKQEALAIIENYWQHDSRTVIAAIDTILLEDRVIEYGTPLYNELQEIKWSDHYAHAIDDPDQALHDNAGFYVDCILWRGWPKVQEMKKEKPDKGQATNA